MKTAEGNGSTLPQLRKTHYKNVLQTSVSVKNEVSLLDLFMASVVQMQVCLCMQA